MKQGIFTEIDWARSGAYLANEDAADQAALLNSMAKEMLSWDTKYQAELQVASIREKLTEEARELLNFTD